MRRRVTFVHDWNGAFDQDQIKVNKTSVHLHGVKAAREDRFTFAFEELPREIYQVVKQYHEIHVRWRSSLPYAAVAPFTSQVPSGLHILASTINSNRSLENLAPLLRKFFGDKADCLSPEDTFIIVPVKSERFSASASSQFYSEVGPLSDFVLYVQQKICAGTDSQCQENAISLNLAQSLDVDYDAISQSVVLRVLWPHPPEASGWTVEFHRLNAKNRIEVGVLANEKPKQVEEVSMGGFLTVLGEDSKPKPTLFSFPSRHHQTPKTATNNPTYTVTFPYPSGLHPTLRLTLPRQISAPRPACALHTYATLPAALFVDKYELANPLLLASRNIRALRSLSGETDLEAPLWAVKKWGSAMLLEIAPPSPPGKQGRKVAEERVFNVDIPLHLRYLPPQSGGYGEVRVPWPVIFWACPTEEGTKMSNNPFDRVNLGYDGLFGPRIMFYHLTPNGNNNGTIIETVKVPVLDLDKVGNVESGTVAVVILGVLWVLWCLFRGLRAPNGAVQADGKKTQ